MGKHLLNNIISAQEALDERGALTEKGQEYLKGLKRARDLMEPSNIILGVDMADIDDKSGLAVIQVFEKEDGTNSYKILKSESFNNRKDFDTYLKEMEILYPEANTLKFGENG